MHLIAGRVNNPGGELYSPGYAVQRPDIVRCEDGGTRLTPDGINNEELDTDDGRPRRTGKRVGSLSAGFTRELREGPSNGGTAVIVM